MVAVFMADGFEEIEAVAVIDLLRRACVETRTVRIGGQDKQVCSARSIKLDCDMHEWEFDYSQFEMLVLPGGSSGVDNMKASRIVRDALTCAVRDQIKISAICAAPVLLGELGLLDEAKAVCYPELRGQLRCKEYVDADVVRDGLFITSKAAGTSVDFALAVIEELKGKDEAANVAAKIFYRD